VQRSYATFDGSARSESDLFKDSPLSLPTAHWDHEPLVVVAQTKCADKSDALQTLRDCRAAPNRAKRLECVRLQRRFPMAGCDPMA